MKMRGRLHKIFGLMIAGSLLALIFAILLPPSMAINLDTGDFAPTDNIGIGDDVNFSAVTITIRGIEHIPLTELNFTIFCTDTDLEKYNVKFDVAGNEILDSYDCFTVTIDPTTATMLSTWYINETGYEYGYGERWGGDPGYGYGYGDSLESNLTLTYTIIFTTQAQGTYYGRLFATATLNSIEQTYYSDPSDEFSVGVIGVVGCSLVWMMMSTLPMTSVLPLSSAMV